MGNIEIESVGKLDIHPDVEEWLISEPISIPFFDRKEVIFVFNGDLENDKDFLADANQSIANLLKMNELDRNGLSKPIYENYSETQDFYDSQSWDVTSLELKEEKEIWKYVYPQEITVCRGDNQDLNIYVLIACECKWEEEHGLQLVFKNGTELTRVSLIDYSPTE